MSGSNALVTRTFFYRERFRHLGNTGYSLVCAVRQPLNLVGDLVESGPGDGWFIVRPLAVAHTPLDPAVTAGCVFFLFLILGIEIFSPSALLGAVPLFPP